MTGCLFVPPYLLESLAGRVSDDTLRSCTHDTLRTDASLRAQRERAGHSAVPGDGARTVSDADHGTELPGRRVRGEGEGATGDAAVDEAYDGMGASRALFAEVFERNSLDDQGHPLDATVHYQRNYANAFWDGRRLVFGDGDGAVFARFTKPMDVIAHEFTHGVTQFSAALVYQGQAGSLNESMSDVFAALTVQRLRGQSAAEASWLIGADLFEPGINARALRSMAAPGTAYDDPQLGRDPQPGRMSDFVETTDDNGGVHINSGIPNHAFYLVATALGGAAWEAAGQIWYAALVDERLAPDADFATFAALTLTIAGERHGSDSTEQAAVSDAWATVEVEPATAPGRPPRVSGTRPAPEAPSPEDTGHGGHVVVVRRSGGFAGIVTQRRLDTAASRQGARVDRLLQQVDLGSLATAPTAQTRPDAYVFSIRVDDTEITAQEPDLSAELAEVVGLVLDAGDEPDPDGP